MVDKRSHEKLQPPFFILSLPPMDIFVCKMDEDLLSKLLNIFYTKLMCMRHLNNKVVYVLFKLSVRNDKVQTTNVYMYYSIWSTR